MNYKRVPLARKRSYNTSVAKKDGWVVDLEPKRVGSSLAILFVPIGIYYSILPARRNPSMVAPKLMSM